MPCARAARTPFRTLNQAERERRSQRGNATQLCAAQFRCILFCRESSARLRSFSFGEDLVLRLELSAEISSPADVMRPPAMSA